jgi:methylglutaconyl-CoA hydratase
VSDYDDLRRTDEGPVATVSLARPESRNALNAALIAEISRCFGELAEDDAVRVVVLTGEGPSFCAGADIGYMRDTAEFSYEENLEDARRLAAMYRAVDELPKPVVAKVRGAAIGGGAGLVARALFLTGERFGAEWAREIGLVHEVVAEEKLDSAAEIVVSRLLQGGPAAQAAIKALLRQVEATEPLEALGLMTGLIAELRTGEEGQEGLGAFLEKREPRWRDW